MKTAWIFQHVPFEGPGAFAPWLLSHGYALQTQCWWENAAPPALSEVDFVLLMGGPMSVNDETEHPWLITEKAWISEALHAGLPMCGVCLGAQLMASSLGASVGPNPEREIGWFPVQGAENDKKLQVLHWHGETFELPEGAEHLESSEACRNQSFRWGGHAVGLQYHLEATEDSLDALMSNCRHEVTPGAFVQSEDQIREGWKRHHAAAHQQLDRLMTDLSEV